LLQLKNHSPFEPTICLFPNEQGIDTLYVVVKAAFEIGPALSIAKKQVPPTSADEYWGDPLSSSIKYASELHLAKPSTDVVLIGRARAPNDHPVQQLDVRFSVAERQKTLRVFGNRVWKNGSISAAQPFESVPIVYEYAFGGKHKVDPQNSKILAAERNPIGRGFRGKRKSAELEGLELPNVEDPACLVAKAGDKAIPAGFAFISPAWLPRRDYAGTYDEAWQKNRAPYMPDDFDPRFFNAAHPDFIFDRYLQGGEPVALDNLSPDGPIRFNLPICQLETSVRVAGKVESPPLNLETVLIEPEKRRLCMTWRSQLSCDKKTLKVEQIDVHLLDLQLDGQVN
jgi:hypothetical protein